MLFILNVELGLAQQPYGYAPGNVQAEEVAGLGSGMNKFVQGMTLFDPASDPALARMKGKKVVGVRCYLRADYKQAKNKRSAALASTGTVGNIVRTQYADLLQGWNDVLFDEPLVIGDAPIYLGVQAYETIGTAYPLVVYTKAIVPHSCFINIGKTSWEEYTDRGTPLIMALVEDEGCMVLLFCT